MSNRIFQGLAVLLVTLPLAACGGGSADPAALTKEGHAALSSGDHAKAVESYQAALAGLEKGTPDYLRAKAGEIEALIHIDAAKARDTLLAMSDGADADLYTTIASKMTSAGEFNAAIDTLDAGMKKYSESPKLKAMLDQVIAEAEKQGDSGALDKLKGLGYL